MVGRDLLLHTRCQFVLLCVLSEAMIQLTNNSQFQATVLLDVVNLVELTLGSVVADKVQHNVLYNEAAS